MAFGIFKKNEERMAPPKAAPAPVRKPEAPVTPAPQAKGSTAPVPQAKGPAAPVPKSPAGSPVKAPPKPAADDFDDMESLDFTGITIQEEKDPVEAAVEEAAVEFATGDPAHCEAILKESIKTFANVPGTEVLWLMLFDLYRATGKREPFSAIELIYAKKFEKQPPIWKDSSGQPTAITTAAAGATPFKGELVAANAASLELILQTVEKTEKPRIDFARIKEVDAPAAERLLEILARGKKIKHPVEMLGLDNLIKILDPKVKARDPGQALWRLLLECYQRQAKPEVFDELALEFAITFEISPPSYEAPPATAKKPGAADAAKPASPPPSDGALYLSGNLGGGGKIDGLEAILSGQEKAVIDMSGVNRIDFACAGVIFTSLKPACMRGVSITIRHPSHLVAALLKVVGVADIATIVHARH